MVRGAGRGLAVVALFVAAGALAGVVWEAVWTPPSGLVVSGQWGLDSEGVAAEFSATAWYVVVALVTGLVLGLVIGWRTRSREILTLAAVVVGAAAAAFVMLQVGHRLGPPDPRALAASLPDRTPLPGELVLAGDGTGPLGSQASALVALPGGALAGLLSMLLLTRPPAPGRSRTRASDRTAEEGRAETSGAASEED